MPYPRKPTANELAGLQCAADDYNTAKAVEMERDGVAETGSFPLAPEAYWEHVYSKVKGEDSRPEVEVFDAALLSYQAHFDVGLGAAGVAALITEKAAADTATYAEAQALALKQAYETEARAKGAMK